VSFKYWVYLLCWTYLITFVCLIISFGLNIGISYSRKGLQNILDEKSDNVSKTYIGGVYWSIRILTILISFLTVLVNFILGWIIWRQTNRERHQTFSDYNTSTALKLSIAMFLNTGVIPILSNIPTSQWFTSGGLVAEVFYKLIMCFFTPIIGYIIQFSRIKKKYITWREKRKGLNTKLTQL